MILKPDSPDQMFFTSRAELVADEALVFAVDEVVDRLDLEPLYACWSEGGRGFYDPAMMLKILFLAYSEGETYSRQIAKRIRYDVRYQYFAGQRRPKYRSICRFRTIDAELLAGYFVQIVRLCEELGLTDVSLVAIDGSKIKASASRGRTYRKEDLGRLAAKYREMLIKDSAADLADVGDVDDDEEVDDSPGKGGVDRRGLKQRVSQALERLKDGEREVNLTDADAKLMKISDGGIRPAYNAQIAVDNNQIIVAADISDAPNDVDNFQPMIEETQRNVNSKIDKYLADGGYYTRGNLKYAAEEGLDVYMPPVNGYQESPDKYGRADFIYDHKSDSYRCPAGQMLPYRYSRYRNDISIKVYRCSSTKCKVCRLKSRCTTTNRRSLSISEVYDQEQKLAGKVSGEVGRSIYNRRKAIVEPVFGNIKFNMGHNRFGLRGLPKVKGEFLLMCIAHNLRKIAAFRRGINRDNRTAILIITAGIRYIINNFLKPTLNRTIFRVKLNYA
jgi:transposase